MAIFTENQIGDPCSHIFAKIGPLGPLGFEIVEKGQAKSGFDLDQSPSMMRALFLGILLAHMSPLGAASAHVGHHSVFAPMALPLRGMARSLRAAFANLGAFLPGGTPSKVGTERGGVVDQIQGAGCEDKLLHIMELDQAGALALGLRSVSLVPEELLSTGRPDHPC